MSSEYYTVNDRPVKVVKLPDGRTDVLVFDWTTGGFSSDRSYREHVHFGSAFKDVDQLTEQKFEDLVQILRAKVLVKHLAHPIKWELSGDGEFPYQATESGHRFRIRINDFPAEPLYTLLVDNEELADLDDWPETWKNPDDATSG